MNPSLHSLEQLTGVQAFFDAQKEEQAHAHPELLSQEDLAYRHDYYITALRSLAKIRRQPDGSLLQSDAELFRATIAPEVRKMAILNNLEASISAYQNSLSGQDLRPHQHSPFTKLLDYFAKEALDTPGHLCLPTGFGKTFIVIKALEAIGIGSPVSAEYPGKKLRALVLVPREILLHQFMGADGEKGLGRFMPDISTTPYYMGRKDLTGDVVVMTYFSFGKLVSEGKILEQNFDVVVYDEAHHALGKQTKAAVEAFQKTSDAIHLGITATPEYNANRQISALFPSTVEDIRTPEAIRQGALASVQGWLYKTRATVFSEGKSSEDFTEDELAILKDDSQRNSHAVEFIKKFVETGRQGIIRCVAGNNSEHARMIAAEASKQVITDPHTKQKRQLRVAAIGGYLSDDAQQELQTAFDDGRLDALAYVRLLDEGWDSERAKFLVSLSPTTSKVNATQRLGRILRTDKDNTRSHVVEFLDNIEGNKEQVTFLDVLDKEQLIQGEIIGKEAEKPQPLTEGDTVKVARTREFSPRSLPQTMQPGIYSIDYKLVQSLTVRKETPPKDWVSLPSLLKSSIFTSNYGIFRFLERQGLEFMTASTKVIYFEARAADVLAEVVESRIAPADWVQLSTIQAEVQAIRNTFLIALSELAITPTILRNRETITELPHVSADDAQRIRQYFAERANNSQRRVSFTQLAEQLELTLGGLTKILKKHAADIDYVWDYSADTGIKQRYFEPEQVSEVLRRIMPESGSMTLYELAEKWGFGSSGAAMIKSRLTPAEINSLRYAISRSSRRMQQHLSPELIQEVGKRVRSPNHLFSAAMIADILGHRIERVQRVLESLPSSDRKGTEHLLEKQMIETFYPHSVLIKVAGQFNKSHNEVSSEFIVASQLAARLQCSAEDIIRYFPGDRHYRTIEKSGEQQIIILPSAAKEIAKAPPAPKGWLSIQELRTLLKERFSPTEGELVQTLDAVTANFNLQTRLLKPYDPKASPRRHFPPEAVLFAVRRFAKKT